MLNMKSNYTIVLVACIACFVACEKQPVTEKGIEDDFSIEILDDEARKIIDPAAKIKVEASGFAWTEGPLYLEAENSLIFSDIPNNTIFRLNASGDVSPYLSPSGYTGKAERGGETGSNGLLLNHQGELILLQHGDRRVAKMRAGLGEPQPDYATLAGDYQGKRLNSPNDGVFDKAGNLYFTDPPYGLVYNDGYVDKQLDFQGVYCLKTTGELVLLDSLSRPNGIALSTDQSKLYVAVSDPKHAVWYQYEIVAPGEVTGKSLFFDATAFVGREQFDGLPDGMKMRSDGYLFATAPGGVWVFNADAKLVARIRTGQKTANCAFTPDEKTLYMTADDYVLSIALK